MPTLPQDASTEALEKAIGHSFEDRELLIAALTHPSLEDGTNYQRLEFFGDRILGLVIAEALYEAFPGAGEGEMSQRLNAHVRKEALAEVAQELDLGVYIGMAGSTEDGGGRENLSILADVMEALIAAIYLDGGHEAARRSVRALWSGRFRDEDPEKDAKTRLQEWLQGGGHAAPGYAIVGRQGPDHAPQFTVRAEAGGLGSAEGEGTSRQAAEFAAAAELLRMLEGQEGGG